MFDDRTLIERLRVRGSGLDPLQSGLRAERALAQTDVRPPALANNAVLIVCRLNDPMPRTLRLRRADERPSPAWQQALRGSIDRLLGAAAYPGHGAVSANTNAVLFTDPSELLGCLSRDWCDGTLISHWRWRALLRHNDALQVALDYWLTLPVYIPAEMDLRDRGSAIRFTAALNELTVSSLLVRVIRTHGLAVTANGYGCC